MFSNKLEILYTAIYYKPTEAKCFEIYRFEAKHSIWSERWGKHLEKFLISHQQSDSWKRKKNKETKPKINIWSSILGKISRVALHWQFKMVFWLKCWYNYKHILSMGRQHTSIAQNHISWMTSTQKKRYAIKWFMVYKLITI